MILSFVLWKVVEYFSFFAFPFYLWHFFGGNTFDIPSEIYNKPFNMFVSKFVGSPSINLIKAMIENHVIIVNGEKICDSKLENQDVILGVRPENTIINENGLPVEFCFEEISGGIKYLYFKSEITINKYIIVQENIDFKLKKGGYFIKFNIEKINIFNPINELRLN